MAPEKLQGDAATNLRIVQKLGLAIHVFDEASAIMSLPTCTTL